MTIELNNQNFEQTLSKGVVLVDFWADWCGPCRILGPTIEEIAKENLSVTVGKLNVDDFPEIASRHGVMSIPTLVFFVDGEVKDTSVGVVSKSVIQNKLDHISS